MHIGILKEINQTPGAIVVTQQGLDLNGRADRKIYLPKSQIQIKRRKTGGFNIYVPDWIIWRQRINWNRITEIEPIDKEGTYER